ncbi:MAG: NADH-quinone oxidoreductase subunit L [Steroidobacteraceae bacterium]|jgi:NADH-quinone oxidoreductase subunit L
MTRNLLIAIPLLPLIAALIAGLAGRRIGRAASAGVTILAVGISCALSLEVVRQLFFGGAATQDLTLYTWLVTDGIRFQVGFLVDRLSALMMAVVTFVSFCVHVYTIGYMREDAGFQRFFSYISLFTFAMLMLVMSNNFMQLFFGWEAVGVVSYLLIGFWYTRPTAIHANLKAFVVNRIGDFGFVLGIAGVVYFTNSLDYRDAFVLAPAIAAPALTLICICLFVGAMGKSAQVPLHVWLPDSMEGPTPISALIHAATMVTAGIFMVARLSPLFEFSEAALSFVLVIGATTALFMGFLGVVNNDIKRVIAYSTLSQLGYMTVALGVSAYSAAIFHLMTHAFFKALLFLAAGSVIIGMHHEQDMRKMGGLARYMPVTAATCWIGALALIGTPFFSGFYSKDALIEAVGESHRWGAVYAYWCVQAGAFVTALYTFRLIFMTFHGEERFGKAGTTHGNHDHGGAPHESPWVVTAPLVALAIPSVIIGYLTVGPLLFGGAFGGSIFVNEANDVVGELGREFHGPLGFALHGLMGPTFWLALAGVLTAWYLYLKNTALPERIAQRFRLLYNVLVNKYYFDWFNERVIAPFARLVGRMFWKGGDGLLIDGVLVDGTARLIDWTAGKGRRIQTGYLYTYAFWMVIGLAALLGWFLVRA